MAKSKAKRLREKLEREKKSGVESTNMEWVESSGEKA
jgi:hypothetical protein